METFAVLSVLLIGALLKSIAAEDVAKFLADCDVLTYCKEGPYCFGYSTKNAGAGDVCDQAGEFTRKNSNPMCQAFGSFQRTADGKLKVKLIGAASYVAIVFAKSSGDLAKDGLFGIACRADKKDKENIQILKAPISEAGTTNVGTAAERDLAVVSGEAKKDGKWIVCEFELVAKPNKDIDLTKGSYKVGLLLGQTTTNGALQGGALTSSVESLDIFSHMAVRKTDGGGDGGGATQLGAAFTFIVLELIL